MLLTSSQISMGISSAIVFTFSTILFLSGYILQQQTVHDIQAVLKPPPDPKASAAVVIPVEIALETIQWNKVAYVQIIQRYSDVCSSSIIFAELARQKSKAKKILLYPRSWDGDDMETNYIAKQRKHTMRFLRKIAVRYNVILRPADTEMDTTGSRLVLPLDRLYSLIDLQALIYLNPSGVVYNATALDGLFGIDPNGAGLHFLGSSDIALPEGAQISMQDPIAAMIKPSMTTYQTLQQVQSSDLQLGEMITAIGSSSHFAAELFGETISLKYPSSSSSIHDPRYLPAYMHFSDPDILGPDYDIPQKRWIKARPESVLEGKIWEGVYAEYRAQRMAVCGLEVEPLPKSVTVAEDQQWDDDDLLKSGLIDGEVVEERLQDEKLGL